MILGVSRSFPDSVWIHKVRSKTHYLEKQVTCKEHMRVSRVMWDHQVTMIFNIVMVKLNKRIPKSKRTLDMKPDTPVGVQHNLSSAGFFSPSKNRCSRCSASRLWAQALVPHFAETWQIEDGEANLDIEKGISMRMWMAWWPGESFLVSRGTTCCYGGWEKTNYLATSSGNSWKPSSSACWWMGRWRRWNTTTGARASWCDGQWGRNNAVILDGISNT